MEDEITKMEGEYEKIIADGLTKMDGRVRKVFEDFVPEA